MYASYDVFVSRLFKLLQGHKRYLPKGVMSPTDQIMAKIYKRYIINLIFKHIKQNIRNL